MITNEEKQVLESLVNAWKEFIALNPEHPDDLHEFKAAIHQAQCIIAFRVAKRVNPEIWA